MEHKVVEPQLDGGSREIANRLDELIDLAENREPRAVDWQKLGWHLSCVPLVHLRTGTWESITHRLVNRLPHSVKLAVPALQQACDDCIASVPRAQDFLVDAIEGHLQDADAQVITNPFALLDSTPTRKAARIVSDVIDDPPNDAVFRLAVSLAAQVGNASTS